MRRACALAATICAISASTAWAQSPVDEGRSRFEQADFYGALEVLGEAEASSRLSRPELTRLYETRILVYLALGEDAGIDRDLASLARLSPDHRFSPEVPPSVQERFRAIVDRRSEPPSLEVRNPPTTEDVGIESHPVGDANGGDVQEGGGPPWGWLAVGGALAVAVGVVVLLLATSGEDGIGTRVIGPEVMGF